MKPYLLTLLCLAACTEPRVVTAEVVQTEPPTKEEPRPEPAPAPKPSPAVPVASLEPAVQVLSYWCSFNVDCDGGCFWAAKECTESDAQVCATDIAMSDTLFCGENPPESCDSCLWFPKQ